MIKQVKFESQIMGDINNLDALVQQKLVPCPGHTVAYQNTIYDKKLTVTYRIAAPNGTDYAITYNCLSNGKNKTDPTRPQYFTGKIAKLGYAEETLNIPLR